MKRHSPRANRLAFERLEDRSLPATLNSVGLLQVTGTDSADVILLRQTGANTVSVSVGGMSRTFSGVREISIDARSGNDYVRMDTSALGTNQSWASLRTTIYGGYGSDTLIGGAGTDKLDGGAGDDGLYGNSGNDAFYGGDGNDVLSGANGNDTMDGGAGNDRIYGSGGNDRLYGNAGTDYVEGGTGNDGLQGGTGFDTFKKSVGDVLTDPADPEDVRQGLSGTCVILSSLQAVSGTGVDLASRIVNPSANFYYVPLYRPGTGWVRHTVYFDGTWTDNDPAPTSDGNAWVLLYQRAFLQECGVNWTDPNAASWASKYGNMFQQVDRGFIALTGMAQWVGSRSTGLTDADRSLLQQKFYARRPEIALTRPAGSMYAADMTRLGLITSHAYSVVGFGSINGVLTVKLRNPWGTDGPVRYGIDDGIIEIKWTDFRRVMLGFCIG